MDGVGSDRYRAALLLGSGHAGSSRDVSVRPSLSQAGRLSLCILSNSIVYSGPDGTRLVDSICVRRTLEVELEATS